MKKNNPRIKDNLELNRQDEINAINMIADMFFKDVKDDDGDVVGTQYTPYLEKTAKINAIVRFFLDGIEVEDSKDVYDEVMNDDEVCSLVNNFIKYHPCEFDVIMEKVSDIVEYRKAENLARIQNETNSILTYKILELIEKEQEKNQKEIEANENLNAWVNEQRKYQEELNAVIPIEKQKEFFENFDMDAMSQSIYKQISEGNLHKLNEENVKLTREIREKDRIIGEKDKIIDFQQKEFAKEKQKENVKNVLTDD